MCVCRVCYFPSPHCLRRYQNRTRWSSDPVTNMGMLGECTNARVGAVCPRANSRSRSEFRASHEHREPDFSSGNITGKSENPIKIL